MFLVRQPIGRSSQVALGCVFIALMLSFYTYISYKQHQKIPNDRTIPSWHQLYDGVIHIVTPHEVTGRIWILNDGKATLTRLFSGMAVGLSIAVVLGILMGSFAFVEALLSPTLSLLAKIPQTAILAVFFYLVGTDLNMYVAMIAFGIVPSMALGLLFSIKNIPEELIYKSYTLGSSHTEVVSNIIVPYSIPTIIDSIRLQLGPAMVSLIAAEALCASVGFGYQIRLQCRLLNMDYVYPYLIIIAAFGFGSDFLLVQIKKFVCRWR